MMDVSVSPQNNVTEEIHMSFSFFVLYVVFVFIWSMCAIPYINVNIPKGEGFFFFSINHARAGKNVGYISSLSGLSAW